jgi:hypothetical protein
MRGHLGNLGVATGSCGGANQLCHGLSTPQTRFQVSGSWFIWTGSYEMKLAHSLVKYRYAAILPR